MIQPITYAYIETTNYCNLKCSFCNRKDVIDKQQHMSIDNFEKLLDKIKDQPIKEAKLMGMGEPFFNLNYHKICKLFKEKFPDSNVISSTNCQYIINKTFKKSLKYIDILYLSIDGYEKSYEECRQPAKWSKLISFLEDLKNVKKYNCKIVINYVINPDNVTDIQKVYDNILLKYDLGELRLNFAQNWSENEQMDTTSYTEEQIDYIQKHWKNNIKGKPIWDYNDCFWVNEGLHVSVEGNITMCCMNTEAKSFGNIFNTPLDEIRQTQRFQDIKRGCQANKPTNHCLNCSYKELTPLLYRIIND